MHFSIFPVDLLSITTFYAGLRLQFLFDVESVTDTIFLRVWPDTDYLQIIGVQCVWLSCDNLPLVIDNLLLFNSHWIRDRQADLLLIENRNLLFK